MAIGYGPGATIRRMEAAVRPTAQRKAPPRKRPDPAELSYFSRGRPWALYRPWPGGELELWPRWTGGVRLRASDVIDRQDGPGKSRGHLRRVGALL